MWRRLILAVVLLGAAMAGLRLCVPSDEQRVRRLLADLAKEASTPARGKTFAHLAAANRVADFFAPEFQINITASGVPDLAISDRGELVQTVLAAKARQESVSVEFLDPRMIELAARAAVVEATAKAQVASEREPFVAMLRFALVKLDGRWRVQKIESLRTFE
jgi:hypothetical protein